MKPYIRERIQDDIERDYNKLREYIDTDDALDLSMAALMMADYPADNEKHQAALDTVNRIKSAVCDAYADDHEDEAVAEFREYLADIQADAERDSRV